MLFLTCARKIDRKKMIDRQNILVKSDSYVSRILIIFLLGSQKITNRNLHMVTYIHDIVTDFMHEKLYLKNNR